MGRPIPAVPNTSWWRAVTRLRPAALDLRTFLKSWRTSLRSYGQVRHTGGGEIRNPESSPKPSWLDIRSPGDAPERHVLVPTLASSATVAHSRSDAKPGDGEGDDESLGWAGKVPTPNDATDPTPPYPRHRVTAAPHWMAPRSHTLRPWSNTVAALAHVVVTLVTPCHNYGWTDVSPIGVAC